MSFGEFMVRVGLIKNDSSAKDRPCVPGPTRSGEGQYGPSATRRRQHLGAYGRRRPALEVDITTSAKSDGRVGAELEP